MKEFAVQVEKGKEGSNGELSVGPVYRNLLARNGFPPPDSNLTTTWDNFRVSVENYPKNRMLGWRQFVDGKFGSYVWKTYMEVYEEVLLICSALRASGAEAGSRVGIYGSNCPQWVVAMEACSAHSLICVPLYDTLGPGAVNFILDHAEIDFVFVQDKKVKQLLSPDCVTAQRLKLMVSFTTFTEEEKDKASIIEVKPYSWNEFLHMGKENPSKNVPPQPSDICTIIYTSGTSGDPKGVLLTHENAAMCIGGIDLFLTQLEDKMTADDVYLSFLPLAHILDRMIEEYFIHHGASVGYYHGDMTAIRDDIMELKPTLLAGVPRVFERIQEGIKKSVQELSPFRRKIFDILYKYKHQWMKLGYKQNKASPLADLLAFSKVKNRLGGRVRLIISGGAPLGSEVEEFLRVTSCSLVVQGYGLTETCGISSIGYPYATGMVGTVGAVTVYNELRLEEVPDMGYNPLGVPSRGEICIRGKTIFAGYHKNPELTTEVIKDGWFHTGDIGELLPNGVVKIIDRKKNLIKLSQGEYVALEYLEKVYGNAPFVEDIWVYGDSFKSMLVAVVVPHEETIEKWASLNGHELSFADLCSLDQLKNFVLSELKARGENRKLRGFEQIKGVILEPCPFEVNSELVTATLKKKRDKLFKHYQLERHIGDRHHHHRGGGFYGHFHQRDGDFSGEPRHHYHHSTNHFDLQHSNQSNNHFVNNGRYNLSNNHFVNHENYNNHFAGDGFGPKGGGGGFSPGNFDAAAVSGQKRGFLHSNRGPSKDYIDRGKPVKLYIACIPRTVTEDEIRPLFEEHGNVVEIVLLKDKITGVRHGACFVKYAKVEEAERAIKVLHNLQAFPGAPDSLVVRYADGERERLGILGKRIYVGGLNKQAFCTNFSLGSISDDPMGGKLPNASCMGIASSTGALPEAVSHQLNQSPSQLPLTSAHLEQNVKELPPPLMQNLDKNHRAQFTSQQCSRTETYSQSISTTSGESPAVLSSNLSTVPEVPKTTPTVDPIDCDWSEHTCPDGLKYYYHCITCESRWEKPEEYASFEQLAMKQLNSLSCQQELKPEHIQSSLVS